MKLNLGSTDRIIRLILAGIVVILFATDFISGTVAIVLLVFATVFILTSMIGFCPLYKIFGFNSGPKEAK